MRTTIIIKTDLLKKATELTGIKEKTALVHLGLEALIRQASANRLIKLGGSNPKQASVRRRR